MTEPAPADDRLGRLIRKPNTISDTGRRYSSFVRSLRVLLPLLALAVLVLAVIWPRLDWSSGLKVEGLPNSLDQVNSQEIRMIATRVVGTMRKAGPSRSVLRKPSSWMVC